MSQFEMGFPLLGSTLMEEDVLASCLRLTSRIRAHVPTSIDHDARDRLLSAPDVGARFARSFGRVMIRTTLAGGVAGESATPAELMPQFQKQRGLSRSTASRTGRPTSRLGQGAPPTRLFVESVKKENDREDDSN